MTYQMRYHRGVYAHCRFCGGRGCLACPGEADAAYNRQFPNGPQPILTIRSDDPDALEKIKAVVADVLAEAESAHLGGLASGAGNKAYE